VTNHLAYRTTNPSHQSPYLVLDEANLLQRIIARVVAACYAQQIYLVSSKACNAAGPDSDFDLLVVVPDMAPCEQTASRLAYELLRGTGTATDVVLCTIRAAGSGNITVHSD